MTRCPAAINTPHFAGLAPAGPFQIRLVGTSSVERYGRHIYRWCRTWKLQDADAKDVTQNVLVKLSQKASRILVRPVTQLSRLAQAIAHHAWRDFEVSRRHLRLGLRRESSRGFACSPSRHARTLPKSSKRRSISNSWKPPKVRVQLAGRASYLGSPLPA